MPESFEATQDSAAPRLLIVDDEPNIRSSLVRALSLLGFSVNSAGSGDVALKMLGQEKYDLMVLDMVMPGISGVEVLFRAHQLYPDLLIIVLTGHATLESAIAAVKAEATDYLRKPVTVQEIADTVTRILHEQAQQQQTQSLMQAMLEAMDQLPNVEVPQTSRKPAAVSFAPLLSAHPVTLDLQNRMVAVGESTVRKFQLTEGETTLLATLMTHPNQVLSCRQIADKAWGDDLSETEAESVVRPLIYRLRRKLEIDPKYPQLIRTIRRRGYLFSSAVDGKSE